MANDRAYQVPTEVLVQPDNQKARIYQLAVEVLYPSSNPTTPTATPRAWGFILG